MYGNFLFKAKQANVVSGEHLIGHIFSTDGVRELVKTSLDARDNEESNELDKNIPLNLTFLRKSHICPFTLLIFWQFSERIQKLVSRVSFSFSDPYFALRRRLTNSRTQYS